MTTDNDLFTDPTILCPQPLTLGAILPIITGQMRLRAAFTWMATNVVRWDEEKFPSAFRAMEAVQADIEADTLNAVRDFASMNSYLYNSDKLRTAIRKLVVTIDEVALDCPTVEDLKLYLSGLEEQDWTSWV